MCLGSALEKSQRCPLHIHRSSQESAHRRKDTVSVLAVQKKEQQTGERMRPPFHASPRPRGRNAQQPSSSGASFVKRSGRRQGRAVDVPRRRDGAEGPALAPGRPTSSAPGRSPPGCRSGPRGGGSGKAGAPHPHSPPPSAHTWAPTRGRRGLCKIKHTQLSSFEDQGAPGRSKNEFYFGILFGYSVRIWLLFID